jgi:hypothetical protein
MAGFERRLSFSRSTSQRAHIIEMEEAHLERMQQQQAPLKNASKPTLWKRLFPHSSTRSGGGNRTVMTSCLSQSSSLRSVHNSPSFAEDFASSSVDEDEDVIVRVHLDDGEDGAVEVYHGSQKSDNDLPVPAGYTCCVSPCGSLEDVFGIEELPSFLKDCDPECADENDTASAEVKEMVREAQEHMAVGEYEQALEIYRRVMKMQEQKQPICPVDLANACYACTRCAFLRQDYDMAFHYALRELFYTKQCSNGVPTLAVAESYHEVARICKVGLGDLAQALRYYRAALSTGYSCLERAHGNQSECDHCQQYSGQSDSSVGSGSATKSLCTMHRAAQTEIHEQIQDSKQCIGRIYFEMGNFDAAMRMI